jgi:hypothetical protein
MPAWRAQPRLRSIAVGGEQDNQVRGARVRPDLSKLSTQQLLTLPLDDALRLSARGCVGNLPLRFDGNVEAPRFRAVEPTIQPMRFGYRPSY